MKKTVKALFSLGLILVLLAGSAFAISMEAGTGDDFYVQDTANVLSAETEELIVNYNAVLEEQCHEAQIVVVTVDYLQEDTEVASLQLMNDWGVGSESDSNGMLLLLVAKEYRGWLATGDGIDNVFTDSVANSTLEEYFWDYIDNDEFDEGVQSLMGALYEWYVDYYDVAESAVDTTAANVGQTANEAENSGMIEGAGYAESNSYPEMAYAGTGNTSNRGGIRFMGVLIALIVLVIIIWLAVSASRFTRMRGWGYGGGFWPIFWFGGPRLYRSWYRRRPMGPGMRPPGPGMGPGMHPPGGPGMGAHPPSNNMHSNTRPGGPGGMGGMGGHPGGPGGPGGMGGMGGMGGHPGGPGGMGGGAPHGGGFGGHGGGGGGGRH